jgi:hypothetical protein
LILEAKVLGYILGNLKKRIWSPWRRRSPSHETLVAENFNFLLKRFFADSKFSAECKSEACIFCLDLTITIGVVKEKKVLKKKARLTLQVIVVTAFCVRFPE